MSNVYVGVGNADHTVGKKSVRALGILVIHYYRHSWAVWGLSNLVSTESTLMSFFDSEDKKLRTTACDNQLRTKSDIFQTEQYSN